MSVSFAFLPGGATFTWDDLFVVDRASAHLVGEYTREVQRLSTPRHCALAFVTTLGLGVLPACSDPIPESWEEDVPMSARGYLRVVEDAPGGEGEADQLELSYTGAGLTRPGLHIDYAKHYANAGHELLMECADPKTERRAQVFRSDEGWIEVRDKGREDGGWSFVIRRAPSSVRVEQVEDMACAWSELASEACEPLEPTHCTLGS